MTGIADHNQYQITICPQPSRVVEFVPVVQLTSGQEVGWSRYLSQRSKNKPYRRMTALKSRPKNTLKLVDTEEVVELGSL